MIIENQKTEDSSPMEDLISAPKSYLESDSESIDDDLLRSVEAFSSDEDQSQEFSIDSPMVIDTTTSYSLIRNSFNKKWSRQTPSGFRSVKE